MKKKDSMTSLMIGLGKHSNPVVRGLRASALSKRIQLGVDEAGSVAKVVSRVAAADKNPRKRVRGGNVRDKSSTVMYNFGGGPRFAFVSASSRHAK